MNQILKAPYLPYPEIVKSADQFLDRYHPDRIPPIPIEDIVEFELGLDIIPEPNFKNRTGIVSALSNNLRRIYIDNYLTSPHFVNRYRYSLAHELGHVFLHGDVFKGFPCRNAHDWKKFMMEVDINEYSWLETHAYQFAGLILVPRDSLSSELQKVRMSFEKEGLAPPNENVIFEEYALNRLKERFQVSIEVIERRVKKDGLVIIR